MERTAGRWDERARKGEAGFHHGAVSLSLSRSLSMLNRREFANSLNRIITSMPTLSADDGSRLS